MMLTSSWLINIILQNESVPRWRLSHPSRLQHHLFSNTNLKSPFVSINSPSTQNISLPSRRLIRKLCTSCCLLTIQCCGAFLGKPWSHKCLLAFCHLQHLWLGMDQTKINIHNPTEQSSHGAAFTDALLLAVQWFLPYQVSARHVSLYLYQKSWLVLNSICLAFCYQSSNIFKRVCALSLILSLKSISTWMIKAQ